MATLQGNLDSIALSDVIQLLNVNKKNGMLRITCGKDSGILHFQGGDIIYAEAKVDKTPEKGEGAAFTILEWSTGSFEFVPSTSKTPHVIRRSVPDLLMEAARTSDSRRRLKKLFPNIQAVPWPTLVEPELTQGLKLYAEDRKVIPQFDGYRNFQEIIDNTQQSEVAVLQAAALLLESGRLELLEPEVEVAVQIFKGGLFRKADHLELPKSLDAHWRNFPPYARGCTLLRVSLNEGAAIETVQFAGSVPEGHIAIPKELMQSWGLSEGMNVKIRPAR